MKFTFVICIALNVYICILQAQKLFTKHYDSYDFLIKETQKGSASDFIIKYPEIQNHVRKQHVFPTTMHFPCTNNTTLLLRSVVKPTSVHRLRPGDIDVIGAMGDSLVAGNGAMEEWALGTMIEHRGISFCSGGQGTWRQYLTLPNILKEFNPDLTGYSTGTGEFLSRNAQMNVAFPVAADEDALKQAKILVKKMKNDPRVNITSDWKMITLFSGANDLCSAQCFQGEENGPWNHALHLMLALDYLYQHLPRTFVNLIPVIDVTVSMRVKRSMVCRFLHRLYCSCFHFRRNVDPMIYMSRLATDYQTAETGLLATGRYEKRDDFAVVLQPFMKFFNAPSNPARMKDEAIDISYITHDCFHFSQKGHALGAHMLWSNLLQPVGAKSVRRPQHIMQDFQCPTKEAPFLFTKENSKTYLALGYQYT